MFEIREIKPSEYTFLGEMLYEAIYFPVGKEKPPKSIVNEPYLAKYVDHFGRKGDLAFVLVKEEKPVGAIWTRLFDNSEEGYGFVDENTPELSMAIRENYRGRGFGARLMEKVCDKLRSEGVRKLSLSVDKQNRALRLYQRCGFEIVGEKGTAYTMLKIL